MNTATRLVLRNGNLVHLSGRPATPGEAANMRRWAQQAGITVEALIARRDAREETYRAIWAT